MTKGTLRVTILWATEYRSGMVNSNTALLISQITYLLKMVWKLWTVESFSLSLSVLVKRPLLGIIITVRNEVAKVMFLQASVCPQGGVPDQVHPPGADAPHLPRADAPRADTPPQSRHPQTRCASPGQVHPPGPGTPLPGPGTPPQTRYTPQTRCTPGTRCTPQDQVHPRDMATAADSTHPTGMHSCLPYLKMQDTCKRQDLETIFIPGINTATSCVRDQDATTEPARHVWETGSLNSVQDAVTEPARHTWETGSLNSVQFMLQWFIILPEFAEFNETSLFRKNFNHSPKLRTWKPNIYDKTTTVMLLFKVFWTFHAKYQSPNKTLVWIEREKPSNL